MASNLLAMASNLIDGLHPNSSNNNKKKNNNKVNQTHRPLGCPSSIVECMEDDDDLNSNSFRAKTQHGTEQT